MEIRKTTEADLEIVLELYKKAREFMNQSQNPTQWGALYPPESMVKNDIEKRNSYICTKNDEILGVFYYNIEIDETYLEIHEGEWLNEAPYGVVHRIAAPTAERGVATYCLNWCFEQSGRNLRIDTHMDNLPMRGLLLKNGFTPCGTIYVADGSPRIAYQRCE